MSMQAASNNGWVKSQIVVFVTHRFKYNLNYLLIFYFVSLFQINQSFECKIVNII